MALVIVSHDRSQGSGQAVKFPWGHCQGDTDGTARSWLGYSQSIDLSPLRPASRQLYRLICDRRWPVAPPIRWVGR